MGDLNHLIENFTNSIQSYYFNRNIFRSKFERPGIPGFVRGPGPIQIKYRIGGKYASYLFRR